MKRARLLSSMLLVLTACGGPHVPLQIIGKSVPINVAFGKQLPTVSVRPVDGGFVITPIPIPPSPLGPFKFPPPPPTRPLACPKATPLSFPEQAATTEINAPPKGAPYSFRTSGKSTLGKSKRTLPVFEQREVGNVETETNPATGATTIRYVVRSLSSIEASFTSFVADQSRLAITAIARTRDGQKWITFIPATPLEVLPIPPQQTLVLGNHLDTWRSAASDATSQTSVTVDGKVLGRARIDACGEIIDTWLAELLMHWVSPNDDYSTTWRINVATQYGGLIVAETAASKGTKTGSAFDETRKATINQVPK